MDSKVVIGIIAVVVIGLGAYGYSSNQKEAAMMEQKAMEEKKMMEEKTMMEKKAMEEKAAMESGAMMEKDGAMMEKKDDAMMSKGSYEVYDASKLAMAKEGKVVLFFKASWCPSCRALDADIKASLADIPAGVTILEVDYDKYGDLKQKYGVTMQHTLVQVDASGNQIMKWSGGSTLEDVVKNIK
jgi:thiol-disulfide isomerase/thioredoxin